ncbi:protein suppressor of sable isoform X3 [Diabrotica virgifera virgifera]|uniref:C3H1-type domain-containing protein n=1 Tax=Diabrotica virgifera virgifera TaxID=50390 RepID=A0ABM5JT50_DIAVI|nr:protein suppressor of sable isoform X3 [Diabrotica virgifera virgifera]
MQNSNTSQEDSAEKIDPLDLEDGEIEDDEEEPPAPEVPVAEELPVVEDPVPINQPDEASPQHEPVVHGEKKKGKDRSERSEKRRHEEKKEKKHMTEAEKSILHLRKREEMQRKKWEKMRPKDPDVLDDDFAKNIEKTLATILNKKEKEAAGLASASGEDAEKERDPSEDKREEKRGKKRRKSERDRKHKQRKLHSPKLDVIDENDIVDMRGGSPKLENRLDFAHSGHSEESNESEHAEDQNKVHDRDGKRKKKKNKGRDRDRMKNRGDNQGDQHLKDAQGVCVFYLQGKCQKSDCPYSHEAVPPMKLELCKFYLMDCCAKGDKCSYMHSEFPCKFYHTGLKCAQEDDCKFAHGRPLSESLKQILFKHIETAPREILGGFPRMNREEALNMINERQVKLYDQEKGPGAENKPEGKGGIPSLFDINVPIPHELLQGCDDPKKMDKSRNRHSRWQEPENSSIPNDFPLKAFSYGQDQDMRITSNGDIDMRTLPPSLTSLPPPKLSLTNKFPDSHNIDIEKYKREAGILQSSKQDVDIRSSILPLSSSTKDTDIRHQSLLATKDIDIRQMPPAFGKSIATSNVENDQEDEPMLQIDTEDDKKEETSLLPDLPKTQRDLYMRIQAHQKDSVTVTESKKDFELDENINWYSDDDDEDDDNRLTIKVDNEDVKDSKEEAIEPASISNDFLNNSPQIKPQDVVDKLGDLSKIDISAEVTKLLTSMSQNRNQFPFGNKPAVPQVPEVTPNTTPPRTAPEVRDPRVSRQDPRLIQEKSDPARVDPRLSTDPRQRRRQSSTETAPRPDKVTIYEQGTFDKNSSSDDDIDIRGLRSDVDLRSLQLPFKGIQNYTPASEIDASFNSHPPLTWKLAIAEIPRPDYTGLKLSISDAEKTGDPRLRKIFRLSIEERDTPLSPKASPKASSSTVRVDPRLRKTEESRSESVVATSMNFNQQITMIRSSPFYQSLTSQQKLLLNQELSLRNDSSNMHDPVLNSLLSNLDAIPGSNTHPTHSLSAALSILNNASSKMNPMMNQNPAMMPPMGPNMNQPGLLGAAPGIPNMHPEFPINFDPRNGGLLGNAPMPFGGFPQQQEPQNFNYNDDYYPPENQGGFRGGNREMRGGFNRDRRSRGRNSYHSRHNGNRNFRNNRNHRSNRTHSPP